MVQPLRRLLVANRGEIAIRVLRSAAGVGLDTVAIHTSDDTQSPHLASADTVVALPGTGVTGYLDTAAVVAAAVDAEADAVHPGYGFLAEDPGFAQACADADLTFVGPTVEQLALFGDKVSARKAAQAAGVPVLAGSDGPTTPDGAAELWIKQHPGMWQQGKAAIFAVCLKTEQTDGSAGSESTDAELVGAMGLEICETNHHAELGYWIGRPFWGRGICTEAAQRVVCFGFEQLGLHKIHAHHLTRNPASGRILEKSGMVQEGLFRGHVRKWGVFEDVAMFGILRSDFERQSVT